MNAVEIKIPRLTFFHCLSRQGILPGPGGLYTINSPVYETPVNFSALVLSVVGYVPQGDEYLLAEVQVCQNGEWSKFFKLAFYTEKLNRSYEAQADNSASLSVDQLVCRRPAQAYRFRLEMKGGRDFPQVAVCVQEQVRCCPSFILPAGKREIAVRPVSQKCLALPQEQRMRVCSPSSLAMALGALGVADNPLKTVQEVYDAQAGIYGNWTFNTAYACRRGLEAFVTRFESLEALKDFVTPDSLVLASIAYQSGELAGAAVAQTPGHVVLVCGWDGGKIRVADPAAETPEEVIRFYDAAEFARAWLYNKHGAAYLVRKK